MSEDVKLSTFSTNADFAAELETHAFTSLLKSLNNEFVQAAIANKNVLLLVPRRESLVLATVDRNTLHAHLFYRNPNDIYQLISFNGQRGLISKSRVYLLGQISIPAGKYIWTMGDAALWSKFEVPKELEKFDSIQLISNSPTLCHISSCDQSIVAMMIRRPIPEIRDIETKIDKKEPSMLKQISNSMPSFFNNKGGLPVDILSPDSRIDDLDYKSYSQRIADAKFYLIALETRSFLNHVLNNNPDNLSNIVTGMGNFILKITSCLARIPANPEILESFKKGLISHILLRIHKACWDLAENKEKKNETAFQIKLSLINLSGFHFSDLGMDGMLALENSKEWNELICRVGSDLLFISQSISVKHMIKLVTKCHQLVTDSLERLVHLSSSSNADFLLPCLILIIIRSHPPNILICCEILMKISTFADLEGADQYCFTNFIAAVTYIQDSIDVQKLNLSSSIMTEFSNLMTEKDSQPTHSTPSQSQ